MGIHKINNRNDFEFLAFLLHLEWFIVKMPFREDLNHIILVRMIHITHISMAHVIEYLTKVLMYY